MATTFFAGAVATISLRGAHGGNDVVDGGFGIDRMYGGAGHDVCSNGDVLGCDEDEVPAPEPLGQQRVAR